MTFQLLWRIGHLCFWIIWTLISMILQIYCCFIQLCRKHWTSSRLSLSLRITIHFSLGFWTLYLFLKQFNITPGLPLYFGVTLIISRWSGHLHIVLPSNFAHSMPKSHRKKWITDSDVILPDAAWRALSYDKAWLMDKFLDDQVQAMDFNSPLQPKSLTN